MLIHGCNAQGVMNSGVAKTFREKYPQAFEKYRSDLANKHVSLGCVSFYNLDADRNIVLASTITQQFYGNDGKKYASYDAIRTVMSDCMTISLFCNIDIVMPKIGCGLGGLDWDRVSTIIEATAYSQSFDIDRIKVFEL